MPAHLTISDMLSIQLADCVRIAQMLSDQATDPHLHGTERLHTIHSLESVVNTSEKLTRTIGRLRTDSWDGGAAARACQTVKSLTSTACPITEAQDVVAMRQSGGQPGNKNRFKSGRFSKRNCALRSDVAQLKRAIGETLVLAEAGLKTHGR